MPRPLRRARLHLAPQAFDRLVQEALDALPPWVQDRLAAVAVVVEAEPPAEEDPDLLGLYTGPTLFEEGSCTAPPMIRIFQRPHERLCRTRAELRREVAETVLHEIAHHFGLNERDLDRLGPLRLPERQE
jgi:predicted Zn-dependent protease with MMP-like domain